MLHFIEEMRFNSSIMLKGKSNFHSVLKIHINFNAFLMVRLFLFLFNFFLKAGFDFGFWIFGYLKDLFLLHILTVLFGGAFQ